MTRTLACHIAESHNFSPPPSPAIAVSATFRRLARLVDARAGSELASTPSPPGVLFPLTVTQNAVDPRGVRAVLFFGYRFGYWGTPVGPNPRRAQQWRHRAARGGVARQSPNRPIARRIRRRRERPEIRRVRRLRLRRIGRVRRPSSRRRRPCRNTPLHWAACNGHSASVAELLLRGADGAVQNILG